MQQYITEKIAVNKLLEGLLDLPVPANGFKNVAGYLQSETKFPEVTFKDVKQGNEKRLGLESLNPNDKETVKQNFGSFIIGKDALFDRLTTLTTGHIQEIASSSTSLTPKQQIAISKKFENLNEKANAEFNTQFVKYYECFILESTDF